MSFKSSLKLDSKIFSREARRAAFGAVAIQSAKKFKDDLRQKMENGPQTGKIDRRKKRGEGFTSQRRRSKKGERPAPDTRELINSIEAKRTSEFSARTEVTADHGEILQSELGRKVLTEGDEREAEQEFIERGRRALLSLL